MLRLGVCGGAPGAVGPLRAGALRHRLLHRLAGAQPGAAVPVLHRLPLLLLLCAALRRHHPLLHLHPDDGAGVTPGHPAARDTANQDRQRPRAHCQGDYGSPPCCYWSLCPSITSPLSLSISLSSFPRAFGFHTV